MALTGLFFDKRPRITSALGFMVFDGTVSEDHQREWVWTDQPIENGSSISDNRWEKSVPLTITVIVSSSEALVPDRQRHIKAWNQLVAMAGQTPAQLFTVATLLGDYLNMGITKISAPFTTPTNAVTATIISKPILVAFTAVAANLADAAQDSGQASVDLGNQGFAA